MNGANRWNQIPMSLQWSNRRWAEYGLDDLNLEEVNANLFGYDIR